MLSSTIKTLMGGTEASSILAIPPPLLDPFGCGLEEEVECLFLLPFPSALLSGVVFRGFFGRPARPCGGRPTGATAAEGVGGAELSLFVGPASGAGGVGSGGGAGTSVPLGRCGASEAEESRRGRADCRWTICGGMGPGAGLTATGALGWDRIVGEEVGWRLYFGRCWWRRL